MSSLKVVGALDNYSLVFLIFINFFVQLKDCVGQELFLVSCPKGQVEKYVNVKAWLPVCSTCGKLHKSKYGLSLHIKSVHEKEFKYHRNVCNIFKILSCERKSKSSKSMVLISCVLCTNFYCHSILSQNFESVKSSEGFIFLVIQIHFPVDRSKTFSHLERLVQIMKISLQLGGHFRGRSD